MAVAHYRSLTDVQVYACPDMACRMRHTGGAGASVSLLELIVWTRALHLWPEVVTAELPNECLPWVYQDLWADVWVSFEPLDVQFVRRSPAARGVPARE